MIDNSTTYLEIPFVASINGKISDELIKEYLTHFKFGGHNCFIEKEFSGERDVSLIDIIGKVRSIKYTGNEYIAEIEIYPSDFKNFLVKTITEGYYHLSWFIEGYVHKTESEISKYCYFHKYSDYHVREINKVFCFFLKPNT